MTLLTPEVESDRQPGRTEDAAELVLSYAREHPEEARAFLEAIRKLVDASRSDPAAIDRLRERWQALILARETVNRDLAEIWARLRADLVKTDSYRAGRRWKPR